MDFDTLRGFKESSEELEKVQQYIDEMIAKSMKKIQDKRKLEEAQTIVYHYPTLQELVITSYTNAKNIMIELIFNSSLKEKYPRLLNQRNVKDQCQMKYS